MLETKCLMNKLYHLILSLSNCRMYILACSYSVKSYQDAGGPGTPRSPLSPFGPTYTHYTNKHVNISRFEEAKVGDTTNVTFAPQGVS